MLNSIGVAELSGRSTFRDLRRLKEDFVSNLPGTSYVDLLCLAQILCLSGVVAHIIYRGKQYFPLNLWRLNTIQTQILEVLLWLFPLTALIMSDVSPMIASIVIFAVWLQCACASCAVTRLSEDRWVTKVQAFYNLASYRTQFVDQFRGLLLLLTCMCILAVDFQAFPRKYAKAETYGAGLMDVGTGMFMLASGMVGRGTRPKYEAGRIVQANSWVSASLAERVRAALKASVPCLALGLARMVATKSVNYQEHVGEYGVHWNFFLTAAAVLGVAQLVRLTPGMHTPVAVLLTVVHQMLLSMTGMSAWAMSKYRDPNSLISLNKEGLSSVLGYIALHYWGAAIFWNLHCLLADLVEEMKPRLDRVGSGAQSGTSRVGRRADDNELEQQGVLPDVRRARSYRRHILGPTGWLVAIIVLSTIVIGLLGLMTEMIVEKRSRRTCNAAYIMVTVTLALTALVPLIGSQVLLAPYPGPSIAELSGRRLLPMFLVANLLTGLVNLTVNTLAVQNLMARLIVGCYMGAVVGVAVALDAAGGTEGIIKGLRAIIPFGQRSTGQRKKYPSVR